MYCIVLYCIVLANRLSLDELLSREPTFGQNDLTPNYWITAARTAGQVDITFSLQIWFSKASIHFLVNQWS